MTYALNGDSALLCALRAIQARGAIGEASLELAIVHAEQFVAALPSGVGTLVDLGSGGGLPGLVIAVRRPEVHVTLVERRQSRADLLSRVVKRLGLSEQVIIRAEDVRILGDSASGSFDAVTARSFAAPPITARWAGVLLRAGGRLVVSEPPFDDADRWPTNILTACGLSDHGRQLGVRVFIRS